MLKAIIYNLKDINADHLIENKCQVYAEGVDSALSEYNSIIKSNDAETILKMKLAIAYASQENAPNNADRVFQTAIRNCKINNFRNLMCINTKIFKNYNCIINLIIYNKK